MRTIRPIQWATPTVVPVPIKQLLQGRPYFPADNAVIMRAQSLLTGSLVGGVCPLLSKEQSIDVLRWAGEMA